MQVVLVAMEEIVFMVMHEPEVTEEIEILRMVPQALVLEAEEVQEIRLEHKLNQASL